MMSKGLLLLTWFVLTLCLTAGAQPAELLVHYKLDDASGLVAADASGNGNDGTVNGTPKWVDGTTDGAFEFSGTENISLPAAELGLTPEIGSVAFWMNADVPSSGINTMFWAGDNTTGGGFGPENEMHLHLEQAVSGTWLGGELTLYIMENADPDPDDIIFLHSDPDKGGEDERANPPVNPILLGDKQWHHIAGTWGNGMATMYIDGEKIAESAYVPGSYALSNIYLGKMADGGRTYTGILDDFRIYNGVLTEIEVSDLFNKITAIHDTKSRSNLSFYPNPALDFLSVNFDSKAGKTAMISVINPVGQAIATNSIETLTGANNVTLDLAGVAGGIYFVQLELDNEITTEKIIVQFK